MQNKIEKLERAVAEHERTKANLSRQLQALEFGLRQERAKQKGVAFAPGSTSVHVGGGDGDKLSDLARMSYHTLHGCMPLT